MRNPPPDPAGREPRRSPVSGGEWLGLALLAALAVFFLALSWRK